MQDKSANLAFTTRPRLGTDDGYEFVSPNAIRDCLDRTPLPQQHEVETVAAFTAPKVGRIESSRNPELPRRTQGLSIGSQHVNAWVKVKSVKKAFTLA